MAETNAEGTPAEAGKRKRGQKEPRPPLAPQPKPESRRRQILVVVAGLAVIGLMVLPFFTILRNSSSSDVAEVTLSEVLQAIEAGQVDDVELTQARIDDNSRTVVVQFATGQAFSAHYPDYFAASLVERLEKSGVKFETAAIRSPSMLGPILLTVLPLAVILGFLIWFARRSGMGAAKSFTRSTAEIGVVPDSRFDDVVGCDEVVDELREIVSFLHDPAPFRAAGANIPRGFLLVGPPGTGKTLLARAVAGEAGVPFYSASGSDFTEMFVGVGAARVRDLFAKAKKTGGIVFLDELDSVGRVRTGAIQGGGGTDEREGTLNALLVEMDGFGKDANVIIIGATNRPDVLDPALLRAGRFDRQITVAAPDRRGRTALLELYFAGRHLSPDVDPVALARRMPGLTGADIANLVNQAALEAARAGREQLQPRDFEEALATTMMGRARRSAVVLDRDRQVTAWHEAGHAVAALALPDAHDPVHVTIVPRGAAGGVTWMGGDDHSFLTRSQARARLTVSLAGRAAEELLLDGDFTQGASGDLASATALAARMVTEWGMSNAGLSALGPEYAEPGIIRAEIDRILGEALDTARTVLAENRGLLESLAGELLVEETVDGDRLAEMFGQTTVAAIEPFAG